MLAFLSNPGSYPHMPESVQVVQTHISWVALAGDLVYKIKKPVDFGFLDFVTLDRRRHFCQREIELNRRLCPDIYLGVVPIVERPGKLHFAGAEEDESQAVDYAVKMKRLDHRHLLSSRLEKGHAGPADIDRIVSRLVPFYKERRPGPDIAGAGRPDWVGQVVLGNLDVCAEYVRECLSPAAYDALRHFAQRFLDSRADLLNARAEGGCIRDCHGDLRPEHIYLGPEYVCIYDCIEFNDRFRFIDVASEIAFLAMELDHAGRTDLRRHIVDSMTDGLDDPGITRLLEFYMSYRAAVRGKVNALRAAEAKEEGADYRRYATAARSYFQRALRYALFGVRPAAVAVMGRIGAGKSTLAAALCDALGVDVLASDRIRKGLAAVPLFQRPSAAARERLYTTAVSRKTYTRLNDLAAKELTAGRSVIADATFGRLTYRKQLIDTAERVGADCLFVEAFAPDEVIAGRLRNRDGGEDVVSDARLEDFDRLARHYEPPNELTGRRLLRVDTTRSTAEILQTIFAHLIDRNLRD